MRFGIDDPGRIYLLTALAVLGAGLVTRALTMQIGGGDDGGPAPKSATLLTGLRGFRLAVIGLALLGVAGGWFWGVTWLVVLSLGGAGEETFESSVMIWGLERERTRRRGSGHGRTGEGHRTTLPAPR